ncbi:hypothetical protein OXIME_000858 [Oxyplasma meridianum]|uniref:Carboxypeptidase regulatory-like domain-containing protein n=1 Tax=Oxyplasma meridianum TaxID=3073602 RepID=A0AAX4NH27_9ARCH
MIPTVFAALPMTYPSSNPVPVDHVFENQKIESGLSQLEGVASSTGFGNSGLNTSNVPSFLLSLIHYLEDLIKDLIGNIRGLSNGVQTTGFSSTSSSSVVIQGYITNASSSNLPVSNSGLTVSENQYYTQIFTDSNGYYTYDMVHQGKGDLSYFVQGYNAKIVAIDTIGLSSAWVNVSITPASRYIINGLTEFSNKTLVPDVKIDFSNKFGSFTTYSSQDSRYSINVPNGTYGITISKSGMNPIPNPYYIIVSGKSINDFNLIINVSAKDQFNVSGFIFNRENKTISGATVGLYGSPSSNTTTNGTGAYRIRVPYGLDIITAVDAAYGYNYTERDVTGNLTDVNITLNLKDPMSAGSTVGQQNSTNVSKNIPGNITKYLKGNNSRVNYSNSTLNLTMSGNITNSMDGKPLSDTEVIFYTDINGTVFAENVSTNGTGYYKLGLSYTGNYSFAVNATFYHPYFFNISITANTTHNFSMVPLQSHIFYVSGYVKIFGPNIGISGSTVSLYSSIGELVEFNLTNTTGYYRIYSINGLYSINASAYGFTGSKSVGISLNRNITDVNFSMNISADLGNGIGQLPPGSGTGIPGLSGPSVSSQLNGSSASSNATGSGPVNLTIHLENLTGYLSNTQYEIYFMIDGSQYRSTGTTNATGNVTFKLNVKGNFTVLAETLYNHGNATVVDVEKNTNRTLKLNPVPVFTDILEIHNAFNSTYANNSVPLNYLNQTQNYIFSISYNGTRMVGINRTYYFRLPEGNYSFQYSNSYFVQKSFWSNVTTDNVTSTVYIYPYLIIIHANSSGEWYYNINGIDSSVMKGERKEQINITREQAGSNSIQVGIVLNGSFSSVYSKTVYLSPGKNIFNVYSNMTNGVYSTDNTTEFISGNDIYVNGTLNLSSNDYLYSVNLSINTSSSNIINASMSIAGSKVNVYRNDGFINLTSYMKITSNPESVNIKLVKNTNFFSFSSPVTLHAYYMYVTVNGSYS